MKFNAQDKQDFIKAINEKGFLLEEKTHKIIECNVDNVQDFGRLKVINYNIKNFDNTRIEIDSILRLTEHHRFIIECKRTRFSWIFPKIITRADVINKIYFDETDGLVIKTNRTDDFTSTISDIAIMINNGQLVRKRDKSVWTSYKDIHEYIRQVLKNTEAYLFTYEEDKDNFVNCRFFPVIVTNAPLYVLKITNQNINGNGDLTDYQSIEPIPYIIYNFPEIMRWGARSDPNIIKNVNGTYMKSVFIVNINHLTELIEHLRRGY